MSPYVTGVQRAVLSFIHYGLSSSFEGCRIQPVVCFMGRFYALDTRVFENLKASLASKSKKKLLVKVKDVLKNKFSFVFGSVKTLYKLIHFIKLRNYLKHIEAFTQDDVLFFPDISWGMGLEGSVKKVKPDGVFVVFYIHDLIPITYPQYCDAIKTREFERLINQLPTLADAVLTNSKATKIELTCGLKKRSLFTGLPEVGVAYLGVDKVDKRKVMLNARDELVGFLKDNSPVFMMVSTIEPRKNHAYLLDVFEALWHEGVAAKLLIIGRVGGDVDLLMQRFEKLLQIGKEMMVLHDVTDVELDYAYRHATALVFPSFAEGFGLPIIESLSNGLPVIVSAIPAHLEIAGDLGMYVDPNTPADMIKWIKEIVKKGVEQKYVPTNFSWLTWRESANNVFAQLLDMSSRHKL